MKYAIAALALLTVASSANAQMTRYQWVQQQNMLRQQRMNDPLYRSYFQLNVRPAYITPMPDFQTTTKSYYRGPAGELRTRSELPKGAWQNGYKYVGSYGPGHTLQSESSSAYRPSSTYSPYRSSYSGRSR